MIRKMKEEDLQQCAVIYAKAFPIEYWGIDWNPDNAKEYLLDYYEQKRFVGYVYEEDDVVIGCIFALCKISGSKKEMYINEMAVLPERQVHIHWCKEQLRHILIPYYNLIASSVIAYQYLGPVFQVKLPFR